MARVKSYSTLIRLHLFSSDFKNRIVNHDPSMVPSKSPVPSPASGFARKSVMPPVGASSSSLGARGGSGALSEDETAPLDPSDFLKQQKAA
jgi:hypothetical protein